MISYDTLLVWYSMDDLENIDSYSHESVVIAERVEAGAPSLNTGLRMECPLKTNVISAPGLFIYLKLKFLVFQQG